MTGWNYTARAADVLRTTQLPIADDRFAPRVALAGCGLRNAAYWSAATKGQDFSTEDRLDTDRFNTALWQGLGRGPQPTSRHDSGLKKDRAEQGQGCAQGAHP